MAEGVFFSVAEGLLKNLGSKALQEIASAWGFKTQVKKLQSTVKAIQDVLSDAEEKQVESRAVRNWLARLRDVVYEADDLFDEFAAVATRKEMMVGNKFTKKVRVFFSHSNQIAFACKIARQVKIIREALDDIRKDYIESTEFALRVRPNEELVIRKGREESHSFVDVHGVIGRDDDKNAIIDMLLSTSGANDSSVSVTSIVGLGGVGKTTLAQFVYNDPKVENQFELRLWVCVSDVFDVKAIIEKMLMSATNKKPENLEMDQLQRQLRGEIGGKKYLLVLDDVWNENRSEWLKLSRLLSVGGFGSRILVTTRSMRVAEIMGDTIPPPYELKGLSQDHSWSLFEKMAFKPGQQEVSPNLVNIGKEIVKKCANVPLAIQTLGSLLYGKEERTWLSIRDSELANRGNDILSILKLSYNHLWSPLKHCFAYCALFPKDYDFRKETLISLWMAEGFIVPLDESQFLEDAGEEYFMTLLQRCFFQDVERDEWGDIKSCKMHDLMHDLAQEVAGGETAVANSGTMNFGNRVRHVSFSYTPSEIPSSLFELKAVRTLLWAEARALEEELNAPLCHQVISNFRCLRVLDLWGSTVDFLPSSIGGLVHLRYLDLTLSHIKALPDSMTDLLNLQTLKLAGCGNLEALPMDIRNLINLRYLDLDGCDSLTHMPSGMGNLTALHNLSWFIVGMRLESAFSNLKPATAQLRDLNALNNLSGKLCISNLGKLENPVSQAKEANLQSKRLLSELSICWVNIYQSADYDIRQHDEAVLEGLQPHPNLKKLVISNYNGQRLPSWAGLPSAFPNLIELELDYFPRCQDLILPLGQLTSLKRLALFKLQIVEYIESGNYDRVSISSLASASASFLPSLEELRLQSMDNLKGWWREAEAMAGDANDHETTSSTVVVEMRQQQCLSSLPYFPKLSILEMSDCPNLTSMPPCPHVKELVLGVENPNLIRMALAPSSSSSLSQYAELERLQTHGAQTLFSLPKNCLHSLTSLEIISCFDLHDLSILEVFTSLSSLRSLKIGHCNLQGFLLKGLQHLTALEELKIAGCDELDLLFLGDDGEAEDGMPWKALRSLRSLKLISNPNMSALPDGLQYATSLQSLAIAWCRGLRALPEWISSLTSLQKLQLQFCSNLECLPDGIRFLTNLKELEILDDKGSRLIQRCRGEDQPKIQHIPFVTAVEM